MPATIDSFVTSAIPLLQAADKPLSLNELYARLPKEARCPKKLLKEAAAALRDTAPAAGISPWPNAGNQRDLFWNQSFSDAVRHAIPRALDAAPMTAPQIAAALRKLVPKAGATRLRDEAKAQLRILTAQSEILAFGNYYCGLGYLQARLGRPAPASPALAAIVLDSLRQTESAPGNYVTVRELRAAPALHDALRDTVADLARRGELVLSAFNTLPEPGQERDLFHIAGEWYIGIARKRASAGAP